MAPSPGTRLGPYVIQSRIGAGGMGEVWRACDTKLARDVALKVLPDHLSSDLHALARFESEAKAVAALSHPHILAIHDFGRIDGTSFAVAELLEGESLRAVLLRGALPVRKALDLAAQLADALAAAHDKGIVHRDVKPENVFLTKDGRARLLDFGLAGADPGWSGAADASAPLDTARTSPGVLLGTVAYMSPEQAQGRPASFRSDQFSLGVVLYEMISGRRPFRGTSAPETLASVIRSEPEPLEAPAPATPVPVRVVVERLLSKDPSDRYDSTGDLARELATWTRILSPAATDSSAAVRDDRRRGRRSWTTLAAGASASALLGAGLALLGLRLGPPDRAAMPFHDFERVTSQPGVEADPALSPDGATLAFTRKGDIWVQRVGGQNPTNLTADLAGYDGEPSFSPDGRRIAFRSERDGGGIFVMGATGESVRRICGFGRSPDWFPDGKRLVVTICVGGPYSVDPTEADLRSVDVETGVATPLARVFAFHPRVSPSGHRVAFCATRPADFRRDIYTVPASPSGALGEPLPVTRDLAVDWSPFWSADGRFLYFASDRSGTMNLWRVPIDERSGRSLGPPEPITVPARSASRFGIAANVERVAFASDDTVNTIDRIGFDPVTERYKGASEIIHRTTGGIGNLRISLQGELLAYNTFGRSDLWVQKTDGTGLRQLTDDAPRDYFPGFSPDGRKLSFQSDRGGSLGVWIIGIEGSSPHRVSEVGDKTGWPSWSPDGRTIAANVPAGVRRLPVPETPNGSTPALLPPFPGHRQFLPDSWSRDGRFLSGLLGRPDGVRGEVAVYDFERRAYTIVSETGGRSAFLSDNRRLPFTESGSLVLVDVVTRRRRALLPVEAGRGAGFPCVAPDDRTIYLLRVDPQADIWVARGRTAQRETVPD